MLVIEKTSGRQIAIKRSSIIEIADAGQYTVIRYEEMGALKEIETKQSFGKVIGDYYK